MKILMKKQSIKLKTFNETALTSKKMKMIKTVIILQ